MDVDALINNARAGACGCGSYERVMRGTSLWGYGPVCRSCRRAWREKHQMPWSSEAAERRRRERHRKLSLEKISNYPDHILVREFKRVLKLRRAKHGGSYSPNFKADEFGLSYIGLSTPLGERYLWLKAEVRRRKLPNQLFI